MMKVALSRPLVKVGSDVFDQGTTSSGRTHIYLHVETKSMDPNSIYGYISSLYKTGKDAELDETSLDILELFAVHREKCLSAYKIASKLKSTSRKLAYKNVNKRVKALSLSGLIQKKQIKSNHNAIHYMLTEYGIYQLFLKKFTFFHGY